MHIHPGESYYVFFFFNMFLFFLKNLHNTKKYADWSVHANQSATTTFFATHNSETSASALETPPAPQQLPTLNKYLGEACPGVVQAMSRKIVGRRRHSTRSYLPCFFVCVNCDCVF